MNRPELNWLLGMYEMEMAVERMLQISEQRHTPFQNLMVTPEQFESCETAGSELSGFCQLLIRRLMVEHPIYHRYFCVGKKLVECMRKRSCWRDMPDPPTAQEVVEEYMSWMRPR